MTGRFGEGWRASDRHTRLLVTALLALFAVYFVSYAVPVLRRDTPFRFGDFFALWSYGRILVAAPAAELYDAAALAAHQVALGMPSGQSYPFPYPPIIMPALWPLGFLRYDAAYAAFMGVSLGLFALAVGIGTPRPWAPLTIACLVAPISLLTLVAGQTGFLSGALFLGGLRLTPARPVLGGLLLGLLAYKPQLGALIPVALAAAGQWRALAAASVTVASLALATSAAFGWHIWADWLACLPSYIAEFERQSEGNDFLMPTLTAALRAFDVPPGVARPAQAALSLAAAVWVWRACRRGLTTRAILALATGTFLAAPHAFIYDLPMFSGALLRFIDRRLRAGASFSTAEVVIFVLALCSPELMLRGGAAVAVGIVGLALTAGALIARTADEADART
jgi:hypothetical protein